MFLSSFTEQMLSSYDEIWNTVSTEVKVRNGLKMQPDSRSWYLKHVNLVELYNCFRWFPFPRLFFSITRRLSSTLHKPTYKGAPLHALWSNYCIWFVRGMESKVVGMRCFWKGNGVWGRTTSQSGVGMHLIYCNSSCQTTGRVVKEFLQTTE